MRKITLLTTALFSGLLTCSAAITPLGYYSFGTVGNAGADSSGRGLQMNNYTGTGGYTDAGNCLIVTNFGVGGPLGGTNGSAGITSTSATKTHANAGSMGGNFWYSGGAMNIQYSNNWVMECWALANGNGARISIGQIACIGSYSGTGGGINNSGRWGCWLQSYNPANDGVVYVQCWAEAPDQTTFQMGPDVLLKNGDADNRWMHLAVVRDNLAGTVTFFTNGIACASEYSSNILQNATASANYPGFAGAQGSPEAGSGGASPFEGYIDELRYSSFLDGQFDLSNLLTRAAGPSIVLQPESTTVWSGGAAPFRVVGAYDTSLTYQWYRGASLIPGAISNLYVLPATTSGDDNAQFTCVLTDYTGISKTSAIATLKVVANNPANVAAYQSKVLSEATLVGYYPMDGATADGWLTNIVDNTYGAVEGDACLDGGTNRAFGQQAMRFPGATLYAGNGGDVLLPPNGNFEFSSGFGSIEAVLNVDPNAVNILAAEKPTWFAEVGGYYRLMADGSSLYLTLSGGGGSALWPVPGGLLGKNTHVVVVFDNGTNVTAYANGQSLGAQAIAGFLGTGGNPFYIAWDGSSQYTGYKNNLFHGTVDELAIYGTNLTAETVLLHYAAFSVGTNTVAANIISLTPPAKTLYSGFSWVTLKGIAAGTPPISYQWYSNSVLLAGKTSSSLTVSNMAAGTYTYTFAAKAAVGGTATSNAVLTVLTPATPIQTAIMVDGPVAFWPLNEASGTTANDYAGAHDATYYGSSYTLNQPGPLASGTERSVRWPGTANNTSRLETPFASELNNPAGPATYEFWYQSAVFPNLGQGNQSVLSTLDNYNSIPPNGLGFQGIWFLWNNNVQRAFTCRLGNAGNSNNARSWNVQEQYDAGMSANNWYHVVVTLQMTNSSPLEATPWSQDGKSGSEYVVATMYVNGVAVGASFNQGVNNGPYRPIHFWPAANYLAQGNTRDSFTPNWTMPFVIGNNNKPTAPLMMNGWISSVAVYTYPLSAIQVSNHYFFAYMAAAMTTEPVGATNTESFTGSVTLTAAASGKPNTYQWYKDGLPLSARSNPDGTAHYPTAGNPGFYTQGVQSPQLVISQLFTNDTGNYQLFVSNFLGGTNSVVAHVLINQDTISPLPTATGATALGLAISAPGWNELLAPNTYSTIPPPSLVKVTFNTRLDFVTATNKDNYVLSGGSGTVTNVAIANSPADLLFGADSKTVSLMTTGLEPGKNYILAVRNVKEQRSRGAAIAPATLYFTTPTLTPGTLCWDYYYKIPRATSGNNLQKIMALATNNQGQLPYLPQRELSITNFDTHQLGNPISSAIVGNQGDDYVAVVSGWITPTVSDTYDFWLSADDRGAFWLNQYGPDPDGAWWPSAASLNGSWPFDASSLYMAGIYLQAGTSYYVQALLEEDGGGDWVAVGWKGSLETYDYNGGRPTNGIPSMYVTSYSRGPAPMFNPTIVSGGRASINWSGAGRLMQSSDVTLPFSQWVPVPGNPASPYAITPGEASRMFYRLVQ